MRIHVTGYRLVRIALPPCLLIIAFQQPVTSIPSTWLKCSSEGVIWMCRASFTNNSCPLPWSTTAVFSQWIGSWFSNTYSATADFSVILFLQASRCSAISSPVSVLSPQCRPVLVYHARPSLTLQKSGRGCNRCYLAYHDKLINQILLFHFETAATPWLQCVRLVLVQF